MGKLYSLNDISEMTGTTIRTLRSDIHKGWLVGTLTEGKWVFSEEDMDNYFNNAEIKKRIRTKINAPAYDFIDSFGCEKSTTCMIFDIKDRMVAEEKNRLLYERMKGITKENSGYTYYFDEKKVCGRFVIIGSISYVAEAMDALK